MEVKLLLPYLSQMLIIVVLSEGKSRPPELGHRNLDTTGIRILEVMIMNIFLSTKLAFGIVKKNNYTRPMFFQIGFKVKSKVRPRSGDYKFSEGGWKFSNFLGIHWLSRHWYENLILTMKLTSVCGKYMFNI